MTKRNGPGRGFTLIELMVVVAILGIIAAIAIPAFIFFVNRSKTSEASGNLNSMFKSAASYYNSEWGGSLSATVVGDCTVGPAGPLPGSPGTNKRKFDPPVGSNFRAINFSIADLVYYGYEIVAAGGVGTCGNAAASPLYTFLAHGNLDGDALLSRFELPANSDQNNSLYHSRGIFIVNESE